MSTTTTNFGWTVPSDTDLVKDGAAAIRTALGGVDTSFVDLKGGTTGQVLSKASGTDLDFTWVAQDDSNAIQNAIVDAKGDLIAATAADTPARLAVGTNGQVLTADSTASTGLKWSTPAAAGGMTLINTGGTTLSGTSTQVSSIPSTYKDLEIWITAININSDTEVGWTINNDTTSDYYISTLQFTNGGSPNNTSDSFNSMRLNAIGQSYFPKNNTNNMTIIRIPNYAASGIKIVDTGFTGRDGSYSLVKRALTYCANTSAITSFELRNLTTGNFQGGTIYVYGVN